MRQPNGPAGGRPVWIHIRPGEQSCKLPVLLYTYAVFILCSKAASVSEHHSQTTSLARLSASSSSQTTSPEAAAAAAATSYRVVTDSVDLQASSSSVQEKIAAINGGCWADKHGSGDCKNPGNAYDEVRFMQVELMLSFSVHFICHL